MSLIEIIILALVQAATEFLPVSSSGHLIVIQDLFNIESDVSVDVMLHLGTLIAMVVYFRSDVLKIVKQALSLKSSKLATAIVVATIPAVVVGGLFEDVIEDNLRATTVVMWMLAIVGLAMIYEKKLKVRKKLDIETMSAKDALLIGFGQLLAFIPGTSRSGITMLTGRVLGYSIEKAARFSFLIGIPVIFGASVKTLLDQESRAYIADNVGTTILGVVLSAVAGFFAISILLNVVKKWGLAPFGWYRIALSALLAILLIIEL